MRIPARHRMVPLLLVMLATLQAARAEESGLEFFERRILPVLIEHCHECHSAGEDPKGGLRLDGGAGIRQGGDSGTIVVADRPDESLLIDALSYSGNFYDMPPKGKLPERVIADFRHWITIGAPLPEDDQPPPPAAAAIDIEQGRQFWSFQPVIERAAPEVSRPDWPRTKLDYFILHKLDEHGLPPAAEAERRTLARRLYFDFTGLPPTSEEVHAFVSDQAPDAYERLVDRLLASPRHGERWGRHWLDLARYAEDNPTSESTCKPPRFPHPYRDWVIRAFNDDLPYDEFVRRQLAADLIGDLPRTDLAALGFLGLSPVYHKEPKLSQEVVLRIVADEWDERLDTITRTFLGLTVACARCHDHKFDPITVKDYYALAGVMASTQLVEWPLVETDESVAEALTETRLQMVDYDLRLRYATAMRDTALAAGEDSQEFEKDVEELEAALRKLEETSGLYRRPDARAGEFEVRKSGETSLFDGPIANVVRDAGLWINGDDPDWTALDFKPGVPRDLPIFIRGSVTNLGEVVPRRFLEVLSRGQPAEFRQGSGRRELADCIVDDAAALAARVIVNRVWGWHFGTPLVQTTSNFGQLGERPSHPELLDDLAARFITHGWSLKWLHREIVLSSTYRQSSRASETSPASITAQENDPDNRLLWRANRKRLEAEAWRDAVLSLTGQLDHTMGGPSVDLDEQEAVRRTVYGTVSRQKPADVLRLFDFPDAKRHSEQRHLTTTPLQQLYLLNSPFLQKHSVLLAERILADAGSDGQQIVCGLFSAILQREPTDPELSDAIQLVSCESGEIAADAWPMLAHALLASNEFAFVD